MRHATKLTDLPPRAAQAVRAILRTPPGGWPETTQAREQALDLVWTFRLSAFHNFERMDDLIDQALEECRAQDDWEGVHPDRVPARKALG